MAIKAAEQRFAALLAEVDRVMRPLVDQIDVNLISAHNAGYRGYAKDKYKHFIEMERRRFVKALDIITRDRQSGRVCDLGCFVPYLPVALARLGFQVKIVDRYEFYGQAFQQSVERVAADNNIEVLNLDILADDLAPLGRHDVTLLMAVVEHLNGSPRHLMTKMRGTIGPGGFLVFEVPNIASLVNRVRALLGYSPLADYANYFASGYPYLGHNREMTTGEVRYLLEHSGFRVDRLECYDFNPYSTVTWRGRLVEALKPLVPMRDKGQSIIAKATPVG